MSHKAEYIFCGFIDGDNPQTYSMVKKNTVMTHSAHELHQKNVPVPMLEISPILAPMQNNDHYYCSMSNNFPGVSAS
jgi:hypothetical protein